MSPFDAASAMLLAAARFSHNIQEDTLLLR